MQLYDVGINEEGTPFLVMEYVAGTTLEEHLESHSLPLQRACTWAADIARALALAHRTGIIHGDIKTGNIFVTPEEKVKLGDFGIAQLATQISGSERVKGTPAYFAPEQILGATQDQRSDQFSFGIVFYELLTDAKQRGNPIGWSVHTIAIETAVEQGLVERINEKTGGTESRADWTARQRAECVDEEQWLQEYCCVPRTNPPPLLPTKCLIPARTPILVS